MLFLEASLSCVPVPVRPILCRGEDSRVDVLKQKRTTGNSYKPHVSRAPLALPDGGLRTADPQVHTEEPGPMSSTDLCKFSALTTRSSACPQTLLSLESRGVLPSPLGSPDAKYQPVH